MLQCCKESIRIILQSGIPHEFRTTVVPGLHTKESLLRLAKQLKKAMKQCNNLAIEQFNYVLQQFRPQNCLDPEFLKVKPYTAKEMKEILKSVQKILPKTKLRGVD